jgi:hypothetical protein
MRKEMGQLLREGQVIEEVIESRRIAVAGHNKSVVPDVGAMEAAGFFYDLGEGRFFYFWAEWDHTATEPEFPRDRLRVVWDARREKIVRAESAGDRVEPLRTLPRDLLHYLPSGSVLHGTLETLEADVRRFKQGFQDAG